MSNPILPSFVHNHKHAISASLGIGSGVLANQVFDVNLLDSALIGGGMFLLSEALITLDAPESVVFSAPGINVVATPDGADVRVSGSVLVPKEVAPQMVEGLKNQAEQVQARRKAKKTNAA